MTQKGHDIIIYANGTAISATRTLRVHTATDKIRIASATAGDWMKYIHGRKEWSVKVGYLVLSSSALHVSGSNGLKDLLQVGKEFTLVIRSRDNTQSVTGTAMLDTADIDSNEGSLVNGNFTFTGTSPLT